MGSMQGAFGRSWMRQPSGGQMGGQQQSPFASMFSQYMQRPMFQAATQQRQPFMNYLPLLLSRGLFTPQQGGMPAQGAQPAPAAATPSAVPPLQTPPPIAAQPTPQLYQPTPAVSPQPAAAQPAAPTYDTRFGIDEATGQWYKFGDPMLGRQPLTTEDNAARDAYVRAQALKSPW